MLCGQEAERRALRESTTARWEIFGHWAAGILTALFIGLVVFLSCAL